MIWILVTIGFMWWAWGLCIFTMHHLKKSDFLVSDLLPTIFVALLGPVLYLLINHEIKIFKKR